MIVQQDMRKEINQRLHLSHLGSDIMVRHAQHCIFRPGMSADIRQLAGDCEVCQNLAKALPQKTIVPIEAIRPWKKVGTGLFTWDDKEYLLIDYFNGWWEVDRLYNTTSTAVSVL